jgi:ABC-type Mn2+/Zn2+ transport system ATPase subunit
MCALLYMDFEIPHRLTVEKITLQDSQCVGIVGPNGAGKTTFLNSLIGLQKIDGTLIWNKHPLHSTDTQQTTVSHQERARTIGSLSSTLATPSHEELLVQDWIQEGLYPWRHKALPIHHEEYITRVSVEFQLQELLQIPLQHLSSGQLRRVQLARALIGPPRPLICIDEPTAHLDAASTTLVYQRLSERARHGALILIVLHDQEEAMPYIQTWLHIRRGICSLKSFS